MSWKVKIPHGRWMAGIQTFKTKRDATSFADRWRQAEVNTGKLPVPDPEVYEEQAKW